MPADAAPDERVVPVPVARVVRWFENFRTRHGEAELRTADGVLVAVALDGAHATASLPFGRAYGGPADAESFAVAAGEPTAWGLLLVRKGGFAVATGLGPRPEATKVGRRHVQGKTKAGGWSQQRYARRRDNQARAAYDAAADHAVRVLLTEARRPLTALVCGGDRPAVDAVLEDRRLHGLAGLRVDPWLAVGDPSAAVLAQAVDEAHAVRIHVVDASA